MYCEQLWLIIHKYETMNVWKYYDFNLALLFSKKKKKKQES